MTTHDAEQELRELIRKEKESGAKEPDEKFAGFENILGAERVEQILKEEGVDFSELIDKIGDLFKGITNLAWAITGVQDKLDELIKPASQRQVGKFLTELLKNEYLLGCLLAENGLANTATQTPASFAEKIKQLPVTSPLNGLITGALLDLENLRSAYILNVHYDIQTFNSHSLNTLLKKEETNNDKFDDLMKAMRLAQIYWILQTPSLKSKWLESMKEHPAAEAINTAMNNHDWETLHQLLLNI